ncbi:hypothetical protein [Roseateles terrae]|uniref:Transporter YbjL n=1 Tax=Roseateles terrae TaxID=431060 RepID=A0ABR6GM56_9BURK|nr:hypothetical protein [Roseateles terrae]MBB3193147.1 putative transporter YbjL [Roseateles terrae]OWQ89630.1 hypothetical protein CDN98_03660 [Roseateles terrae]
MKSKFALVSVVAAAAVIAAPVMAAVPDGAAEVFTTAAADAKTVLGYAFTCMAAVVGGFVVMKLVKRAVKSAT